MSVPSASSTRPAATACGGPARRAAGHPARGARIARRPVVHVGARKAEGQLIGHGLADQARSRADERGHGGRMTRGHRWTFEAFRVSEPRPRAGHVEEVLHGEPEVREGSPPGAGVKHCRADDEGGREQDPCRAAGEALGLLMSSGATSRRGTLLVIGHSHAPRRPVVGRVHDALARRPDLARVGGDRSHAGHLTVQFGAGLALRSNVGSLLGWRPSRSGQFIPDHNAETARGSTAPLLGRRNAPHGKGASQVADVARGQRGTPG